MKIYLPELNMFDKILRRIFAKYTEKVYRQGIKDGFNWHYKKNMGKIEKMKIVERQ